MLNNCWIPLVLELFVSTFLTEAYTVSIQIRNIYICAVLFTPRHTRAYVKGIHTLTHSYAHMRDQTQEHTRVCV